MKSIIDFIAEKQNFLIKGHSKDQSVVDLDLPSGTQWSTCNIGADKPEDYGLLFQFGIIYGCKYGDKDNKFVPYDVLAGGMPPNGTSGTTYDAGDTLKPEDDAAYQATKGKLRTPTKEEMDELVKHTEQEWTELNGIKGMKFISKKNKAKWIFIPSSGYCYINDNAFRNGNAFRGEDKEGAGLWSASVEPTRIYNAGYLCCLPPDYCRAYYAGRDSAHPVRGVLNK